MDGISIDLIIQIPLRSISHFMCKYFHVLCFTFSFTSMPLCLILVVSNLEIVHMEVLVCNYKSNLKSAFLNSLKIN
jgi:hypothetical protein